MVIDTFPCYVYPRYINQSMRSGRFEFAGIVLWLVILVFFR
jgi:hypothetical protein